MTQGYGRLKAQRVPRYVDTLSHRLAEPSDAKRMRAKTLRPMVRYV